jgi:hypothetical protein
MKKRVISLLGAALSAALVAWTLAPAMAQPDSAAGEAAQAAPDLPPAPAQLPSVDAERPVSPASTGVVCTFNCNDGYGLLYNCPDPSLNVCCQQAQPACSSHGGLESGICQKGHLGLPCTPI